jgi:protoporphyrinogen oxidase
VMREEDTVILGAGLCGLSAASELGERAVVLEREDRPGGLVRTECRNGYWFDHVIHLLYFRDPDTERRVRGLLGDTLQPCPPVAWIDCAEGTARFPLQQHIGALNHDAALRCIRDLVVANFERHDEPPRHYEELLRRTFGDAMCQTFFFPYNRKMWKRPLSTLAPDGFQWNLARPTLEEALAGALNPAAEVAAYNQRGWYPRPPTDAPCRGMEVLTRALAERVPRLHLQHVVERIDLRERTVVASVHGEEAHFRWETACLSTLPLPLVLRMCSPAPAELVEACSQLKWNRVYSVALSVQGPRPHGTGHWRYYSSPDLSFTRAVFLHEFDPQAAPPEGWPLLIEVTQPAEEPLLEPSQLVGEVQAGIRRARILPENCEVVDTHVLVIDPAYVVFTPQNNSIMQRARDFLVKHGVTPLGRYGRWEYSSMASVMADGFRWARAFNTAHSPIER